MAVSRVRPSGSPSSMPRSGRSSSGGSRARTAGPGPATGPGPARAGPRASAAGAREVGARRAGFARSAERAHGRAPAARDRAPVRARRCRTTTGPVAATAPAGGSGSRPGGCRCSRDCGGTGWPPCRGRAQPRLLVPLPFCVLLALGRHDDVVGQRDLRPADPAARPEDDPDPRKGKDCPGSRHPGISGSWPRRPRSATPRPPGAGRAGPSHANAPVRDRPARGRPFSPILEGPRSATPRRRYEITNPRHPGRIQPN